MHDKYAYEASQMALHDSEIQHLMAFGIAGFSVAIDSLSSIKYGKVIYMPDIMVAYRQIQESSWNNRNEVQKAYVNYKVYLEAKKVLPEMKLECFLKCQFAWEQLYKNRKSGIDLANKLLSSDKFLNATAKYSESGKLFRRWYEIKYFIPAHSRKAIKLLRIMRKRTYRKIK